MKIINPFVLNGYSGPKYFCDREKDTNKLINALTNGRNTTLVSQRKMGKTVLIMHVFNQLKNNKDLKTIYFEIMGSTDLNSFVKLFGKAIFDQTMSITAKSMKKIGDILTGFHPALTYDPVTNAPELELKHDVRSNEEKSLSNIFNYIRSRDEHYLIAIDEFQQILNYPEKSLEATLRSYIQSTPNANFVFSGSRKHLLIPMFNDYSRPFYQSTDYMEIDAIDKNKYTEFIFQHFSAAKKKFDDDALEFIFNVTGLYTYYVHLFCNRLYSSGYNVINIQLAKKVFKEILKDRENMYYSYKNFLTNNQWDLLKAIAKEKYVEKPNSVEFIQEYSLGAASSVSTALNSLIDKDLVVFDHSKYFLTDVFFSEWLKRNAM